MVEAVSLTSSFIAKVEYGEKGGSNDGDKTEVVAVPLTSSIFVKVEYGQMDGYARDTLPLFAS